MVIEAMEAKTGRGCRGHKLVERVLELVDQADVATLLDGVANAPSDYMGPMIVEHLAALVDGRLVAGDVGPSPASIMRKRDSLRELAATYERDAGEVPDDIAAELAWCDNALDGLVDAGGTR